MSRDTEHVRLIPNTHDDHVYSTSQSLKPIHFEMIAPVASVSAEMYTSITVHTMDVPHTLTFCWVRESAVKSVQVMETQRSSRINTVSTWLAVYLLLMDQNEAGRKSPQFIGDSCAQ